MIRVALLVAVMIFVFLACGPQGSDRGIPPGHKLEKLDAKASCRAEASGVCLNYITYPTDATESDLRSTCETSAEGVWAAAACSQEDVFAQCTVLYMGGEVVTYFLPPKDPTDARSACDNQDGEYQAAG